MAGLFVINTGYQKQNIESKLFQNFIGKGIFLGKVKLFLLDKIACGKLDLSNNNIDMRGSVVPIKVISQIISAVPAIGELMIGLKKSLFVGQSKMLGFISNPKVILNNMSFAPGIIRDIFSKD